MLNPVLIVTIFHMPRIQRLLVPILLLLILSLAAGLRFYNLNWDGGIFAHPDERSTVAFYAPSIQWPANPADILNPRASRLNPFWNVDTQERRSYTYGHFPLYVLVLVAHLLQNSAGLAQSWGLPQPWLDFLGLATSGQGYAQIGRALVALSDVFSVLLLFLMGRRLYGPWGGLLAAAFSALTVLQIQLAHFFAVDPISTTFTLLAIYGSMEMYRRRSMGAAVLAGVGVGLAVASKFSALPIVAAPVLAGLLAIIRPPAAEERPANQSSRMMALALLAVGLAFVLFAVTSPFVLLDFGNFKLAVLEEQGNMVRGLADFPFTRQYRGTVAYWYFIEQQLNWGMGWALGLTGLAGAAWVIIKTVRGKAEVGELLSLAWLILYFGPTGLFLAKFMRYMVPVVPFLSLFGAGLIVALWRGQGLGNRSQESAATNEPQQPPSEPNQLAIHHSPFTIRPHPPAFILRTLAVALAAITLISSAVWSLAFVNGVYGTEHTWITFSRWVYQNVPNGACIAFEHWDDRLPTNLPEPDAYPEAHQYNQPQLPMYDDDTQQKYEYLRSTLTNCDYIVLATNRLWRTIPKLPERYPMSTRFYQALFSGELGFALIHSDETPPRLGPIKVDDQSADESFTVYDHPKPMLFKKVRQLLPAEWDALLGNTWQNAVMGYTGKPTLLMQLSGSQPNYTPEPARQNGKSLLLNTPVDQLPVIDDFHWNALANNSTPVAVAVWWLAVALLGLAFFPLTFLLFHRLSDRGYSLSRGLGLLLVSYLVWLSGSVVGNRWLGNSVITIFVALSLGVMLNAVLALVYRDQLAQFRRERGWLIVANELVFGLIYLLFVFLRVLNPDLWQPWLGGEKMLEIGFLNAIVKSAAMPPYDPFFANGVINYYYYGLFLVGILIKLTGITPTIAFNLAVPTLAALTAAGAFGLAGGMAAHLSRAKIPAELARLKYITAGLFGVLFITVMGNLEGAAQLLRDLGRLSDSNFSSGIPGLQTLVLAANGFVHALGGQAINTYNYWDPTRVIPETINEFPFFSFLFADLHPHMIGLPFTLLIISLVFNWLLAGDDPAPQPVEPAPTTPAWPDSSPEAAHSSVDTPSSMHGNACLSVDTPSSMHGDACLSVDAPSSMHGDACLSVDAPSSMHGDACLSVDAPSSMHGDACLSVDAPSSMHGDACLSVDAPSSMHGDACLSVDTPSSMHGDACLSVDAPSSMPEPAHSPAESSHSPFTIHHSPFTIHHSPFTLPDFLRWLAFPFALGAVAVINTWDLPTYLGLILAGFLLAGYRRAPGNLTPRRGGFILLSGVLLAAATLAGAYGLYLPFFANYQAPAETGVGLVTGQTALDLHLKIWGFFIFVVLSWLWLSLLHPGSRLSLLRALSLGLRRWNVLPHLTEVYRALAVNATSAIPLGLWGAAAVLAISGGLFLAGYRVPAYLLPLLALALLLLFRREVSAAAALLNLLMFTGLLVLLGVEFVFLRDFLGGGDYYRMNTLFKFYFQVWGMFGLAAAVALPPLWDVAGRWRRPVRWAWYGAVLALLLGGLVYPVFGTRTRIDDRFPGAENRPPIGTLNGLAYMTAGSFEWPAGNVIKLNYDYEAISWLQTHVAGTPIIAEAKIGYYREGGMRVAAYTGLPSILGGLHQGEQRPAEQIGQRDGLVNEFWQSPDPTRALELANQLGLDYIYVGQLERAVYGPSVEAKFEQLRQQGALQLAYDNPQTKIYKVVK